MRWVLVLLMVGCGGPRSENCQSAFDVCPGSTEARPVYLCDGGPCPAGVSDVTVYFECICPSPSVSVIVKQPGTDAECAAAHALWASTCH